MGAADVPVRAPALRHERLIRELLPLVDFAVRINPYVEQAQREQDELDRMRRETNHDDRT